MMPYARYASFFQIGSGLVNHFRILMHIVGGSITPTLSGHTIKLSNITSNTTFIVFGKGYMVIWRISNYTKYCKASKLTYPYLKIEGPGIPYYFLLYMIFLCGFFLFKSIHVLFCLILVVELRN
jgi:hypothetical protein